MRKFSFGSLFISFGSLFKVAPINRIITQKSAPIKYGSLSTMIGGFPVYGNSDSQANIDAYSGNSAFLYAVVRRIAKTAAMVPLTVYKVKNDTALKDYQFACKQENYSTHHLLKKEALKLKALEKVPEDNPLQKLIDFPNPSYSKTEHNEGVYTFKLLTGNACIHTPLLELGVNAGKPIEMWLMPSQFMSLQVSDTWPRTILEYRLQIANLIKVPVEEVLHLRYFNPKYSYVGNELWGFSPVTAGNKILTRQEAETDYSVNAFQNSGISGIVANESLTMDDVGKEQLGQQKTSFYSEASGIHNARKLLFTVGKMTYTAIGLSPVDMQVIESSKMSKKDICSLFGLDDRLFNNDSTGSENSVGAMIKQLWTNAALPEVYAYRDVLNHKLVPRFSDKGVKYFIDADITGITELQEDTVKMMTVFSTAPAMNPNLINRAMGWGESNDPLMDKWYVKQGYTPIEDLQAVDPLPQDTPNGN